MHLPGHGTKLNPDSSRGIRIEEVPKVILAVIILALVGGLLIRLCISSPSSEDMQNTGSVR